MRRRRRGAAHGRAGRRRGGAPPRARSRDAVRGGVRGDGRAGQGRSPRRRREVRRASRRRQRRRRRRRSGSAPLTFNPLSADDWPKRREALDRFAQAGRRVIVRNRAEKGFAARASASPRVGFCANPSESLLTEKGAAAYAARATSRRRWRVRPTTQKRRCWSRRSTPRDARSRARARRGGSRGAPGRRAPGRVGVSLYRTDSELDRRRERFRKTFQTTTKRVPNDDEPRKTSVAFVPRRARVGVHAPPHHR